jgi:hypothetical protein
MRVPIEGKGLRSLRRTKKSKVSMTENQRGWKNK